MGETAIKAIARLKEFAAWYRAVANTPAAIGYEKRG